MRNRNILKFYKILILIILLSQYSLLNGDQKESELQEGFIYLKEIAPSIIIDIRNYTSNNFTGKRVHEYQAPKCILKKEAVLALKNVQNDLRKYGLSLKTYDGYRFERAVKYFVKWAGESSDDILEKRSF